MAANKREGRTYRFQQLPPHVDEYRLPTVLCSIEAMLGPLENIQVHSLASCLDPWEKPPTKTATITFSKLPSVFDNERVEWILPAKHLGYLHNVIVDVHFLGFTSLNDVLKDHCLDLIAISGLASHPFGSWKQRGESSFMWLRDSLPVHLKRTRTILYGYDTALITSESFQTIDDIALAFIARLRSIGRAQLSAKPVIFIAHSLGGILLKRTLLEMANSGESENFMLGTVQGIILFGVPNKGMAMSHLLPMVQDNPNAALVTALSPQSAYLSNLDEQFSGIALPRKMKIISVYETKRSQIPQYNSTTGRWERDGPYEILVEKNSAIHQGSGASDIFPIDADHSHMVKFAEGNPDYRVIAASLQEMQEMSVLRQELDPNAPLLIRKRHDNMPASSEDFVMGVDSVLKPRRNIPSSEDLLRSLWQEDSKLRSQEIDQTHGETFEWIWRNQTLGFQSWLEGGDALFWISGKPGSGKSTFMKYIYMHDRTRRVLNTNSGRKRVHAAFFFHDRGSHTQKSFEGLLRSILHQLISSDERVLNDILPLYQMWIPERQKNWHLEDLEAVFARVTRNQYLIDFYLFLDALDEYDGPPEAIAKFVKAAINVPKDLKTTVKVCFSSRPWNVFTDNFEHSPGFKIHEQTSDDVWLYMRGRFRQNKSTTSLLSNSSPKEDSELTELMTDIAKRAEGVFLWLRLVLDDLLDAHKDGATTKELYSILLSFPEKLEDLYSRLIRKISLRYRFESYAMLEILLRYEGRMDLADFQACLNCAALGSLDDCIANLRPTPGMQQDISQFRRRLKSRCGGLLEVVGEAQPTVQFMHQTVKDFVSRPGFQNQVFGQNHSLPEDNGYSFLTKYCLARMAKRQEVFANLAVSQALTLGPNVSAFFWSGFNAYQAELTLGKSQKRLLDQLDPEIFLHLEQRPGIRLQVDSVLSFAVTSNLFVYVQQTLQESNNISSDALKSLLQCVASTTFQQSIRNPNQWFYDIKMAGSPAGYLTSKFPFSECLDSITRLILQNSPHKTDIFRDMNLFQILLYSHFQGAGAPGTPGIYEHILRVARVFLEFGHNPDVDIMVGASFAGNPLISCKPLHVSSPNLMWVLLEHGADVNSLDSNRRTPLDVYLLSCAGMGNLKVAREALDTINRLIEHEACVTEEGKTTMQRYILPMLQRYHFPATEQIRNPRLLERPDSRE